MKQKPLWDEFLNNDYTKFFHELAIWAGDWMSQFSWTGNARGRRGWSWSMLIFRSFSRQQWSLIFDTAGNQDGEKNREGAKEKRNSYKVLVLWEDRWRERGRGRERERERERERNKKHKIPSFNKQTSVMYIHSPLTVEQICSHSAYEQQ